MTATNPPTPPPATWSDWANRTTAILAVLAALSSGRWGASNLQAILEQGKVNDTWAYFQAKSIKEHSAAEMRDLTAALSDAAPADRAAAMQKLHGKFADEAEHEQQDKARQQQQARAYEANRDRMVERGFWFEISFTMLQLGVILCTIAIGAKTKGTWLLGIFMGVLGVLVLANGFYRFVHAPRSWYQGTSESMAAELKPSKS